ncbi:hypothetical protein PGT21_028675 [Puccinia graminis f. sp. tritici]|uniref:Uncharacterized protein n=1 Tax=Puccinia graminis f. sp. tritici TaxID=56615 RepID=A0A5B0PG52_PUCGR|nr:hypothetical protein PGT21_028675 [Puccinia graminis f. sp. tritici]KAA1128145.1 hypothetical protein PGTUg99_015739 [Puccinia graminis f. sp. tritici]
MLLQAPGSYGSTHLALVFQTSVDIDFCPNHLISSLIFDYWVIEYGTPCLIVPLNTAQENEFHFK